MLFALSVKTKFFVSFESNSPSHVSPLDVSLKDEGLFSISTFLGIIKLNSLTSMSRSPVFSKFNMNSISSSNS